MATTDAQELNEIQSSAIIYEASRRSVWLNAANRRLEEDFANAYKVGVVALDSTGQTVQDRTREQLEGAITYTTSGVAQQTFTEKYFNGFNQLNMTDYRNLAGGGRLESVMAERLGIDLALHVDAHLATEVAGTGGVRFDTVNGSGQDNDIIVGTAGSVFLTRAFPSRPSGTNALEILAEGVGDAHQLLAEKNVVNGDFSGDFGASAFSYMCPVPVARTLADHIASIGQLENRASPAGEAIINRGIFGTTAYYGTAWGITDIVGTTSLPRPSAGNWLSYILPTNGNLVAGFPMLDIDEARFGEGNTDGAYVYRRTAVGAWFAGVINSGHIIRVQFHAE